jgi:hypothetical protein
VSYPYPRVQLLLSVLTAPGGYLQPRRLLLLLLLLLRPRCPELQSRQACSHIIRLQRNKHDAGRDNSVVAGQT